MLKQRQRCEFKVEFTQSIKQCAKVIGIHNHVHIFCESLITKFLNRQPTDNNDVRPLDFTRGLLNQSNSIR